MQQVLQVERAVQHGGQQPELHEGVHRDVAEERLAAQQADVDERVGHPGLCDDEGRGRRHSGTQHDQGERRVPAPAGGLLHRQHRRPQAADQQRQAPGRIRPGRVACAGFAIATSTSAAIPTGTLRKNTARHDTASVSAPPISGPIARKIWLMPT